MQRDYGFGRGKHKSLTKATYEAIGDHFRKLWGQEAGWAQTVSNALNLHVERFKAQGDGRLIMGAIIIIGTLHRGSEGLCRCQNRGGEG